MFLGGGPALSCVSRACFGVLCWMVALRPPVSVVPLVFDIAFFACVLRVFRDCERVRVIQSESE